MPSLPRMFRYLSFSVFLIVCFFAPHVTHAFEKISSMEVRARLETPRLFSVEERILYDFGQAERHGIFRSIPILQTKNGYFSSLRFAFDGVERDGHSEPHSLQITPRTWTIKVGDPDVLIQGSHTYAIRYHSDRVIRFFPDHDELYWNVTGNEWPVGIWEARFILDLPPGVAGQTTSTCFTGISGSTEQACRTTVTSSTVQIEATRPLQMNEGLTVAISFPKGVFVPPTSQETILMIVQDNWIIGVPFVVLLIMLGLWFRYGREPETPTVVPQYDPPDDLSPGVIDAIFHEEAVSSKGVTATLLDLARREHLHIRFETKDRLIGADKMMFTFLRHASTEPVSTS